MLDAVRVANAAAAITEARAGPATASTRDELARLLSGGDLSTSEGSVARDRA